LKRIAFATLFNKTCKNKSRKVCKLRGKHEGLRERKDQPTEDHTFL
jgi:hypothetical protein